MSIVAVSGKIEPNYASISILLSIFYQGWTAKCRRLDLWAIIILGCLFHMHLCLFSIACFVNCQPGMAPCHAPVQIEARPMPIHQSDNHSCSLTPFKVPCTNKYHRKCCVYCWYCWWPTRNRILWYCSSSPIVNFMAMYMRIWVLSGHGAWDRGCVCISRLVGFGRTICRYVSVLSILIVWGAWCGGWTGCRVWRTTWSYKSCHNCPCPSHPLLHSRPLTPYPHSRAYPTAWQHADGPA